MNELQRDRLADEAAQQVRELGQDVGQVEGLRLQRLAARERQQLTHQSGGAVGVLLDLHDVGEGLVARRVAQQQEVAEPDHRGQEIVEVVGDAAGELTDGLHFLGLNELLLERPPLGGIHQVRDQAGPRRGLVESAEVELGQFSVAAGDAHFERRAAPPRPNPGPVRRSSGMRRCFREPARRRRGH